MMKRNVSLFGLLLVLALVALCLAGCSKEPGTVEGTVTNGADGTPIAEARVVVFALEKSKDVSGMDVFQKGAIIQKHFTDENGKYSTALEPDTYVMQVWLEGIEVAERMVEVKSGRVITVDFAVTP